MLPEIVSYCLPENLPSLAKYHNKKVPGGSVEMVPPCNCRNKKECWLEGNVR